MHYWTHSLDARVPSPSGRVSLERLCLGLVKGSLEEVIDSKHLFLHTREEEVLNAYTFELKQHSFLLGRLAAKKALKEYEMKRSDEHDYLVVNGSNGEPVVLNKPLHLSIAHSASLGLAVASSPLLALGIDIECPAHCVAIQPHHFSEAEQSLFSHERDESLIKCLLWSAKEALVKLLKTGFTIPLNLLELCEAQRLGDCYSVRFKYFSSIQVLLFKTNSFIIGIALNKGIEILKFSNLIQAAHGF